MTEININTYTCSFKTTLAWEYSLYRSWTSTDYFLRTLNFSVAVSHNQVLLPAGSKIAYSKTFFCSFLLDLIYMTRDIYIYEKRKFIHVKTFINHFNSCKISRRQLEENLFSANHKGSKTPEVGGDQKPSHLWFLHQLQSLIKTLFISPYFKSWKKNTFFLSLLWITHLDP